MPGTPISSTQAKKWPAGGQRARANRPGSVVQRQRGYDRPRFSPISHGDTIELPGWAAISIK